MNITLIKIIATVLAIFNVIAAIWLIYSISKHERIRKLLKVKIKEMNDAYSGIHKARDEWLNSLRKCTQHETKRNTKRVKKTKS